MEYNWNGILIIMSCKSILSPTGFHENITKSMKGLVEFHGTGENSSFDPQMRSYAHQIYLSLSQVWKQIEIACSQANQHKMTLNKL